MSEEPLCDHTEDPYVTDFEIEQCIGAHERKNEKLPRYPKMHPLSKRPSRKNASPNCGPSNKNDIYCNGVVDMTLIRRYDGQLGEDEYPKINSFLSYAVIYFNSRVNAKDKTWERHCEESHGGGIFTIRIV
jgi:hypothetical protein